MNKYISEEQRQINNIVEDDSGVLVAYNKIPYALLNVEFEDIASDIRTEFIQIYKFYSVYKKGKSFTVEGTNGDYVPATLKYKMI